MNHKRGGPAQDCLQDTEKWIPADHINGNAIADLRKVNVFISGMGRAELPGPIFTDGMSSQPWSELVGEGDNSLAVGHFLSNGFGSPLSDPDRHYRRPPKTTKNSAITTNSF